MPLVTRKLASSEQAWEQTTSCKFLSKNAHRTPHHNPPWLPAVTVRPSALCDVISAVEEFMLAVRHQQNPKGLQRYDIIYCVSRQEWTTREECSWSHAWQRFKRSKGVNLNGTLERKIMPKHKHCISALLPTCWLLGGLGC
jgi:hypothetical protein